MITVYEKEIQDGLAEQICKAHVVACFGEARLTDVIPSPAQLQFCQATNLNQIDLFYLETLLVSTGSNLNDDFFSVKDTWLARATPEDKPFNYEHNSEDIIGHITDCYAVDNNLKPIPNDTDIASLPAKLHLLTKAVLYKMPTIEDKKIRMEKIIAEIGEKKWFVSMEALFKGFDYFVVAKNQELSTGSIKERTEDTAWMTKHLRAFGGTGEFENYKIYRVLKNITFAGKGLVRKPANPESVIFSFASEKKNEKSEDLVYSSSDQEILIGDLIMADNAEQIKELEAKLAKANEMIASFKDKGFEDKIAQLTEDLKNSTDATKAVELKLGESVKQAEELGKQLQKANEDLKVKADALASIEAEKVLANRIAQVKAAYEVDETEAKEILETLANLNDEQFDKHIKAQAKYLEKKKAAYKAKAEENTEVADKTKANEVNKDALNKVVESKSEEVVPVVDTAASVKDDVVTALAKEMTALLRPTK